MKRATSLRVGIMRWSARMWSVLMALVAVMMLVSPDPYQTGPVAPGDKILLSLWGLGVIGLLLGWRWERLGAYVAIGGAVAEYVGFRVVHGSWPPGPNFVIVPLVVFVMPAVLYLLAGHYSRLTGNGRAMF